MGDVSEQTRISRSTRVAARDVDGKVVVVVVDTRKLHVLNEVGSLVWQLADGRSISEVIDEVTRTFDVDRAAARKDVSTFVDQLVALRAIETREASS